MAKDRSASSSRAGRLQRGNGGVTPRAILFDAGDTLFRLRRSVGEVYAEAAARHGVMVAAAEIDSRFRSVFRRMPPLAFLG